MGFLDQRGAPGMEWVGPGMLLDTPTVPQETIQPQMSSLTEAKK